MTFKADLENEVKEIFEGKWKVRKGKSVPSPEALSLDNDTMKLNATVLYADMSDSTILVDNHQHTFAAEIYKAYLRCAARIIKNEKGAITAYDGDRVMAVFLGDAKESSAVLSAMKIHYAVTEIINPALKICYPEDAYQLKHVIGIDASELFVARIGVKNDSDLVWVGRAANYAAKLCSLSDKYSIYITSDVFDLINDNVKYSEKNNQLMWGKKFWKARDMQIYRSKCMLPID